jgi:hypothetical protein
VTKRREKIQKIGRPISRPLKRFDTFRAAPHYFSAARKKAGEK